jgi:hypothetical protein
VTHETGDVRPVIERLRQHAEGWLAPYRGAPREKWQPESEDINESSMARECMRAADLLESLTAQPAPSGWQQRIAEWRKKAAEHRASAEKFTNGSRYHDRVKSAHHFSAATLEMCANDLEQNAVDALPPAPDARYADNFASCHHCGATSKQVICPRCGRERDSGILPLDSLLRTNAPAAEPVTVDVTARTTT